MCYVFPHCAHACHTSDAKPAAQKPTKKRKAQEEKKKKEKKPKTKKPKTSEGEGELRCSLIDDGSRRKICR